MSETLCTLRGAGGGGGRYTETSLWTNPSPTSEYSGGNVTLSDSLSNYKYIKIKTRLATTNANTWSTIYLVNDFKTFAQNSIASGYGHIGSMNSSNARRSRGLVYVDDTTVNFKVAYEDGNSTLVNTTIIPTEILGLNELDHGKRESSLGTLTYQTSSNFKVTLGYKPKALQVILRGNDTNTITLQYDESISTTKYIRNYTASTPQSGWQTIGSTANQRRLWSIDDDGFTLTPNTDTSTPTIYYSAVGDV